MLINYRVYFLLIILLHVIQIYDPATNSWSEGPLLTGFRQGFCAVAIDDQIYIAGGFDQVSLK